MPPTSAYLTPRRPEPPLPPRWVTPARTIEKTPLTQFVILSMLLHALFILIFGAPSGGSREGRAMWGSMQVTLPGPLRAVELAPPIERAAVAPAPVASAPAIPVPPVRPPRESEERLSPLEPSVAAEIERTAVPEPRPAPFDFPPLLDRIVVPDRKLEMAPPLRLPLPAEAPALLPPPEIPAPPVDVAAPAPVPVQVPAPAPAQLPAPPPVPAPLPVTPAPLPPVERAPLEAPALPAVVPTPPVDRPPVEVPALPVPRIESIAPPRIETLAKPVETAPAQEIPVSPKPPVLEHVEPRLPPGARVEPIETPARIERALPRGPSPPLGEGRGEGVAPPRGETSPLYDPTLPSIDLDAVRNRAGQIAREGSGRRAILPFPMPPAPGRRTKMETAIENARKPDCRTAYSALGLAAIVPLIANEFGEGKCRW